MKPFYLSKLIIPILILLGLSCGANAQTTFSYTGSVQTYVVPSGVSQIGFDIAGAQGSGSAGANGARVQGNLNVTPGQTLYIYVGGAGSGSTGGFNGGGNGGSYGGGGGTDIRTSASGTSYTNRLVVAGGGGGEGYYCYLSAGGSGGYPSGGTGVSDGCWGTCYAGTGGTQTGAGSTCYGYAGGVGYGGNGYSSGGGGGGGYYGGGGSYYGGGAGGGSSWSGASVTGATYTNGSQTSNGYAKIYGPTLSTTTSSLNFGAVLPGTTSVPAQFFAMNGTYMGASPLTITAPANFILSTDGISWSPSGGSISYTYTPPTISSAGGASNIYVKFVAPSTPGSYCGNITISGGGISPALTVNVCGTSASACAGPVSGGTSTATPSTGGSLTQVVLSLSGVPLSAGLSYQWQSATSSSGPWTNIAGAVLPTYTFLGITSTMYYQCIVSCPASGSSAAYTGASVAVATPPTYSCSPQGNVAPGGNPGQNAVVGNGASYPFRIYGAGSTLSDPTSGGLSWYIDQTATTYTCTMQPAQTYSITVGGLVAAYASCQLWIDFNNNGIFETTESIGGGANYYSTSAQFSTTIAIPPGVAPGIYRLRVQAAFSSNYAPNQSATYPVYPYLDPCTLTHPQYQETRDYNVTIGAAPCSGTPFPGISDISATVGCSGFNTNLFTVGTASASGLSYQWMQSPTIGGYFACGGGSAAPNYTATVTATGTTYYVCKVTCANGGGFAYTNPQAVTLNPPPAAISPTVGSFNICNGLSASFASSPTGGTWASSTTSVISIGSASGLANSVSVGTSTLTYTLPTGCYTTAPVTVMPSPATITGTLVLCQGATTSLSDALTGGTWTSSTPSVATVGSASGVVTATATGSFVTNGTINYTLTNGCAISTTVTVNPLPTLALVTISGSNSYCYGSPSTADIRLGSSLPGTNYQLQLAGVSVSTLTGTGGILDFGVQTATGTYTVLGNIVSTGCQRTMAGSQTVAVNPLPIAFPVSVTSSVIYCAGVTATAPHLLLGGSQAGIQYQAYLNGTVVPGLVLPGTGTSLDFGPVTSAGTYTIIATNPTTGCSYPMTGSGIVVVNPAPTAYSVLGGGNYCAGGPGVDISLSYSSTGISYQLYNGASAVGGPVAGTGTPLDFGLQSANGTYSVVATNVSTGCTKNMTGTPSVFMNSLPNVYAVTGGGSYCAGGAGVDIGVSATDAGVNYQLFLGPAMIGSPVTGTGLGADLLFHTAAGVYTVTATDPGTGCSSNMTGSATITVNPLPTVYNVTGGGNYCAGTTGVPVGLSNSAIGIDYQLYVSGAPGTILAGTGSPLSFGTATTTGSYTIVATNVTTHCIANMSGTATVGVNPLPTRFNVTGTGSYCVGGTGVDVGLDFSETGVKYQLFRGTTAIGAPVTGTGANLDYGLQTTAGTYSVVATNASTLCANNMNGSAVITINPLPANHLVTGGGSFCSGGGGVDVGLNGSNTGVNYQLYLGLSPITTLAGTGSSIDFGNQLLPGTYNIQAVDTLTGCTKNMVGGATVAINPLPTQFSVTGGGIYCAGGTGVHIGLSGSAIGVKYQMWNGTSPTGPVLTGSGGAIDFGAQIATGTYTVQGANTSTGCTNTMTGTAVIATNPAPATYAVTGGGSYCTGGIGVHVGLSNSDFNVNYQLMRGFAPVGAPVAGTGAALDFGSQTVNGNYSVIATDAITGCTRNMAGTATVATNTAPSVYSVAGGGNYCTGGAGFHVFLVLSNSGISYQLYNGSTATGAPVAGSGSAVDFGLQTTAGVYTVVATNNATGCTSNMAGSAAITVSPLPAAHAVTGGGGYCPGGAGALVGLDGTDAGVKYQLLYGITGVGSPITGTGSPISFGLHMPTGSYSVVATDLTTGCASNMTGAANVYILPVPTAYSVTGGGTYCATGTGLNIGLNSTDTGVNYQLYLGGTPSGIALPGTGGALDFGRKVTSGNYTAVATDANTGCTSHMTGSATINVAPVVLPHVAVASSINGVVCTGQSVTYSATPVNGGTAPSFQWMVNGVSAGVGSTYTYVPLNNDVLTATIHSNATCAIPDTGSTSMTIVVSPMEMPSVNVNINPGTLVCSTAPVDYTAVPLYGGTAPALVWLKNGVAVATGTSYSYTPSNGDIITFLLGSNFNCRLADTVFSVPAVMDVQDPVIPTVQVTSSAGVNISAHQAVTFTATVTHGGPGVSFQWVVNSHIIAGATTAAYTVNDLADHDSVSCRVTGICGLTGFNEVVVRVNNVGVVQVSGNSEIRLVPNPNKGEFSLKGNLGTAVDGEASIEVTDMLGQVIYTGVVKTQGGNIDEHVKLNGTLANGMYLLNVHSGNDRKVFHFVIEQ